MLRDGNNNAYAPPAGDKDSKFVCFAADGGAYVWGSSGDATYYDPKGNKATLTLASLDVTDGTVIATAPAPVPPHALHRPDRRPLARPLTRHAWREDRVTRIFPLDPKTRADL